MNLAALVFVVLTPAASVAGDDVLGCFDRTEFTFEALDTCYGQIARGCFDSGTGLLDYAPQTVCFEEVVQSVRDAASEYDARFAGDSTRIRDGIRAAAFRRSFAIAEAKCDYLDELMSLRRDDGNAQSRRLGSASCTAAHFATAYWLIAVHDRVE